MNLLGATEIGEIYVEIESWCTVDNPVGLA
jgi:hypothetical protein